MTILAGIFTLLAIHTRYILQLSCASDAFEAEKTTIRSASEVNLQSQSRKSSHGGTSPVTQTLDLTRILQICYERYGYLSAIRILKNDVRKIESKDFEVRNHDAVIDAAEQQTKNLVERAEFSGGKERNMTDQPCTLVLPIYPLVR